MNKCDVVHVAQSPMNRQRWLLELECGREVWVTSSKRPSRKAVKCDCEPTDE